MSPENDDMTEDMTEDTSEQDEENEDENEDEEEYKPMSYYDSYEEYLKQEMLEDESIKPSEEEQRLGLVFKIVLYLLFVFVVLSLIGLFGYVIFEVITHIASSTVDII